MPETNPLVLSGAYERVFACEAEAGDVTVFGERVESVERVTDDKTLVRLNNGQTLVYGQGKSTLLIETR